MSCSLMIDVMRLWNASFSSSKNCSLGSIVPVVSLLLDHSIDFIKPLAQPSVSTMWLPKSFSFDVQFISINPIHINDHLSRIHSCNHMYSSQHVFHFYNKLISWGVGPTLSVLHGSIIIIFVFFSIFFFELFTDVLIKVYVGYFFPNVSNADFISCIKAYLLTSSWNWGAIILPRLSV